jgi:predicted NBD/HSP70 family sugar kinase
LFDPAEIIVGGPVSVLLDQGQGLLEGSLQKHLMPGQPAPPLRRSKLGPNAAALGGAFILHRQVMTVNEALVYRGVRG